MAPNVAVPIPPIVKAPNLRVRSPAPAESATAMVIRLRGLEKSTLFSTQGETLLGCDNQLFCPLVEDCVVSDKRKQP